MPGTFLQNATEFDLTGIVPPEAVTAVLRVTIAPAGAGLLIYTAPGYDMPIVANGPVWEGHVECQPPRLLVRAVGDPEPVWIIECLDWGPEREVVAAAS